MCIYCGTRYYRKIYENHVGAIPIDSHGQTYEIHHIDGNHENNEPDNLKAVTIEEHYDIHHSQGDWGACFKIAMRMSLSVAEKSDLARLSAEKRIREGKHPWQTRIDGTNVATDRVNAGTHPWQTANRTSATGLSPEAARKMSLERIEDGTHPFLKKDDGSSIGKLANAAQIENCTHPFLKRDDGSSVGRETTKRRTQQGENPFLGKFGLQKKRVEQGTHNFLGGEMQRTNAYQRLADGTHPSQVAWKCEVCGKEGKGKGNHIRHHGNNCSKK